MTEPTYRITKAEACTESDDQDVGYVELCCQVWEAAAAGAMLYREVRLVPVGEASAAETIPVLPPGSRVVVVHAGEIVLDASGMDIVRTLLVAMDATGPHPCRGCGRRKGKPHSVVCLVARVAALLPPKPEGT